MSTGDNNNERDTEDEGVDELVERGFDAEDSDDSESQDSVTDLGEGELDEHEGPPTELLLSVDQSLNDSEVNDDPVVGLNGDLDPLATIPPPSLAQLSSGRFARVAAELKAWSAKHSVAEDPYVSALVAAIEADENLTAFATTDPFQLLPEPEPNHGSALNRIARVLTMIRNVLVFAPVLLTWLAISQATEGFGRYSEAFRAEQLVFIGRGEDAPDQELNFLQFWESGGSDPAPEGFEPLDDFWRITDVATLDALLIAVIIALTFIAGSLEGRGTSRRSRQAHMFERDRARVAMIILQGLQGSRSIDSETLEETLAVSLSSLSEAARDVNQAASRLESASVGLGSLTPRVAELSDEVAQLSSHFSTDVQQSINALTTAVATLGSSLEGDLQRFMADVLAGLEEVVDRLKSTSVGVEYGTKQLRDDLDAIHQRLARVAGTS